MKVLISNNAVVNRIKRKRPEEGTSNYERSFFDKLRILQGTWQEVETKCLFEDQFNLELLRVMATDCDDIDFSPWTYDEYKKMARERYAMDWPGSDMTFYQVDAILFRAGKGVDPAEEIYKRRGYDMGGKRIRK